MTSPHIAVAILAAGSGTRVGAGVNKVLLPVAGQPTLIWSIRTALELEDVHRIVLVGRLEDRPDLEATVAPHLGSHDLWLVDGAATRHGSERNALEALRADIEDGEIDVVVIHDAARPLASRDLWTRTVAAATASGGAIPVVGQHGLVPRDVHARFPAKLVAVQTPQAFRARPLLAAYDEAERDGFTGTDTAGCLARYTTVPIVSVLGEPANVKLTWAEDVRQVEALLLRRVRD